MTLSMKMPLALVLAASCAQVAQAQTQDVEVLHWWTSGGEAESVAELKKMMEAKGDKWKDFAVAGGGGENAMTVLSRAWCPATRPLPRRSRARDPGVGRGGRARQFG